jgi:hypothetical protein
LQKDNEEKNKIKDAEHAAANKVKLLLAGGSAQGSSKEVLHASRASEFSHSLDPKRTGVELVYMPAR